MCFGDFNEILAAFEKKGWKIINLKGKWKDFDLLSIFVASKIRGILAKTSHNATCKRGKIESI